MVVTGLKVSEMDPEKRGSSGNIGEEKMTSKDSMFSGAPTLQLDPGSATGYVLTMMLHVEPIIT